MSDAYLAALETEKAGYARYGREDKIAEVDAEIARVRKAADGASPEPEPEPDPEPETAAAEPPENTSRPRGRPRKAP